MAAEINGKTRCVIISGSPCFDAAFIKNSVRESDFIICADSGLSAAKTADIKPGLLVGDLDSYKGELPENCEIIRLRPDKDDTDTLHCVKVALERGYREFALLAATGGRLDHTLANISVLEYLCENGARGTILSESETVCLLERGTHSFDGYRGKTFSVLPLGCDSVELTYSGAEYPLENGVLRHGNAMGISNVFAKDKANITVHSGRALLCVINE